MKITKKKLHDLAGQVIMNSQQKSIIVDSNGKNEASELKPNSKLERVKSMPVYENVWCLVNLLLLFF